LAVAGETGVENLLRLEDGEGPNRGLPAMGFNMLLTWTVAGLATLLGRFETRVDEALVVGVFKEVRGFYRMAGTADLAADESSGLDGFWRHERLWTGRRRLCLGGQDQGRQRQERNPS